jgi:hypothetical protein
VEFVVGASSITKDITDSHEKREQRISGSHSTVVTCGEVTNKRTTRSLEHIIGDIKYPEAQDKYYHRTGPCFLRQVVTHRVTKIGSVANEKDCNCNCDGPKENEGATTTET